jgi:hypothetical protein
MKNLGEVCRTAQRKVRWGKREDHRYSSEVSSEPQSRPFRSVVKPAQYVITLYFRRRSNGDRNNRKDLSLDNMTPFTNGNSVENVSTVRYAE